MKNIMNIAALCAAICLTVSSARADDPKCKIVTGKASWTLVPSNDPFGRLLGPSTGSLKATTSSVLTLLAPQVDGSFTTTSADVWVLGPQDLLFFSGVGTFAPIPGQPVGTVLESVTLSVLGGTGAFTGATGTIEVTGTGFNLFGPNAGPGNSFFDLSYRGTVCSPK